MYLGDKREGPCHFVIARLVQQADFLCLTEICNGDTSWEYAGYQMHQVLDRICGSRARSGAGIVLLFSLLWHARVVEDISERYFQFLSVVYNCTRMANFYLAPLPTKDVLQRFFSHLAGLYFKGAAILLGHFNPSRLRCDSQANWNGRSIWW